MWEDPVLAASHVYMLLPGLTHTMDILKTQIMELPKDVQAIFETSQWGSGTHMGGRWCHGGQTSPSPSLYGEGDQKLSVIILYVIIMHAKPIEEHVYIPVIRHHTN